jgi:hypothetical protein
MAWYYGTYSCGHDGRVNIIGPTKDRQYIADCRFERLCEKCYKKKLESDKKEINAESAEKAKEMELPELIGTEKQVAWANTLRQKFIEKAQKFSETDGFDTVKIDNALQFVLISNIKASWYIDSRKDDIRELLAIAYKEMEQAKPTPDTISANEIKAEATVFPENKITYIPVEITVTDDRVTAIAEKNETLRSIVKQYGYTWDGIWKRKITEKTGSAADRAAELGNALLSAGFPIIIYDADIRKKAIDANFESECCRWILYTFKGEFEGCLTIEWEKGNEKLYQDARKLPRARYHGGLISVKMEYFREVLDFANMFGFKISRCAQEAISNYTNALNDTPITPKLAIKVPLKDGLVEILQSGSEVIDDLKD